MQSILVVGGSTEQRKKYAFSLCEEESIHQFDITVIDTENEQKDKKVKKGSSIGIEEIRFFQKTFYLTPLQSKTKAFIIFNAQYLTIEAQHALLKTLEEPPLHTLIILTAVNQESLLPTILSRCAIKHLVTTTMPLSVDELSLYNQSLMAVSAKSLGARLKKAQEIGKTKEDALLWLEKTILSMRNDVLITVTRQHNPKKQSVQTSVGLLRLLQKTYAIIYTTNVSFRLALEVLLLELSD